MRLTRASLMTIQKIDTCLSNDHTKDLTIQIVYVKKSNNDQTNFFFFFFEPGTYISTKRKAKTDRNKTAEKRKDRPQADPPTRQFPYQEDQL